MSRSFPRSGVYLLLLSACIASSCSVVLAATHQECVDNCRLAHSLRISDCENQKASGIAVCDTKTGEARIDCLRQVASSFSDCKSDADGRLNRCLDSCK
jgi:hypothetical protein